jgi:hypothetical protein
MAEIPIETTSEAPEAAPVVETKTEDAPATGEPEDLDAEDFEPGELRVDGLRKVVKKERELRKAATKAARESDERAKQLQSQIQAMQSRPVPQAAPQAQAQTAEDIEAQYWADPAAFTRQHTEREVARVRAELTSYKLDTSEDYARRTYPDYADKAKAFFAMASSNRELAQQAMSAPNPGEFVYRAGQQLLLASEIGNDPSAYEARLRAKWEAERSGEASAPVTRPAAPPRSLASVRGSGATASRSYSGPRSAEDLYGK